MDDLTRERFEPVARRFKPRADEIDLIIERRRILTGETSDRAEVEQERANHIRAARMKRDRLLVRAIRKAA